MVWRRAEISLWNWPSFTLFQDKKAQPNKIHYFLSASKDYPGKFMLTYMPRDHARHEYVTVTPDGFKFRRQNFETLSSLMKWFKEHFRDPIPGGNYKLGKLLFTVRIWLLDMSVNGTRKCLAFKWSEFGSPLYCLSNPSNRFNIHPHFLILKK